MGAPGRLITTHARAIGKLESVSMGFNTKFPLTMQSHDVLVVFVDWLTKMVRLSATTTDVSIVVVLCIMPLQVAWLAHGRM